MERFRDNEWDLNQFLGNGQEFEYFSENSKLKQLVLAWPGVDMVVDCCQAPTQLPTPSPL